MNGHYDTEPRAIRDAEASSIRARIITARQTMNRAAAGYTISEAGDYLDALRRLDAAIDFEQAMFREDGDDEAAASWDTHHAHTRQARAIYRQHLDDAERQARAIIEHAKRQAAAAMRAAGLPGEMATACETDDYGVMAF